MKAIDRIRDELSRLDLKLAPLIEEYGQIEISLNDNYFETLASSIVGQQLSNKVADVIWNRLIAHLGVQVAGTPNTIKASADYRQGEGVHLTPESIIAASVEDLRLLGLSFNKISYLKNLSQAVIDGDLNFASFQCMSDEEIILELTKIKGIGRWTAEMFLIFSLGRQDVFSLGDGGLYSAISKLYNLEKPTKKQIKELTQKWSPYRTYASLYLWKSLDNETK